MQSESRANALIATSMEQPVVAERLRNLSNGSSALALAKLTGPGEKGAGAAL